jgi:hypothetical protein
MATIQLLPDFKEFLKLLNSKEVEYLLVGGYAVNYYGYSRATADIDIWVATNEATANKMVDLLTEFGFATASLSTELFLRKDRVVRMGVPPFRIEVLTGLSGIDFRECYEKRVVDVIDGIEVNILSLQHLKINKKASGRLKDLNDIELLP